MATEFEQRNLPDMDVDDIPWHRLVATEGYATKFPQHFDKLRKSQQLVEIVKAEQVIDSTLQALALSMENQSTLWPSTPFAMLILLNIRDEARNKDDKNPASEFLADSIDEFFAEFEGIIDEFSDVEHPKPLAHFNDMLKEEYLWPGDNGEDGDDDLYMDDEPFEPQVFYSFYHYTSLVIQAAKSLPAS